MQNHILTITLGVPLQKEKSQNSTDDEYNDDYDDYYDEDETSTTMAPKSDSKNFILKTKKALTTATALLSKGIEEEFEYNMSDYEDTELDLPKRSNHVVELICPKACLCSDEYQTIDCSNGRLTQVPKDIPSTAITIDLSYNKITKIEKDDFANCSKTREINLRANEIAEIEKEVFSENRRLNRLLLTNNKLTTIDPDTFSMAKDLDVLDLSNNSIILPPEGSFLNQPSLLELFCRNCSWTTLYDESFANLSSLTSLKLDGNNFNKKINTKAFEPMKNLIKLRLPELEQESIQKLCTLLKSIDNISLKRFDVSCFELVLGTSYNESLIFLTESPPVNPPAVKIKNHQETNPVVNNPKGNSSVSLDQHSPAVKNKVQATMDASNASANSSNLTLASQNENISLTASEKNEVVLAGNTVSDSSGTEKAYQVPISEEAVHYMLISIMVLAVIGLIIGLICRKDVGGIKTKCCRTRKPPPGEQTRPGEDIPLNKIA